MSLRNSFFVKMEYMSYTISLCVLLYDAKCKYGDDSYWVLCVERKCKRKIHMSTGKACMNVIYNNDIDI